MSDTNMMEQPSLAEQANEIAHVVGVMSGKGGVGKSLVTGLLASAFKKAGCSVGILDADITGPSIPKMFGITERPEVNELGIFPVESQGGIKIMSINLFLNSPDDAVIWRGPKISGAVTQFWNDVLWNKLDYLFVDLPPGTADVPLTVMQSLPLESVVIVTSPQDLAAMVVKKAIKMCQTMEVPVLGLVQNMAYLKCPNCDDLIYPFGKTNGEELAHQMGLSHILDLPIDPRISAHADSGSIEDYEGNAFIYHYDILSNAIQVLGSMKGSGVCCEGNTSCR